MPPNIAALNPTAATNASLEIHDVPAVGPNAPEPSAASPAAPALQELAHRQSKLRRYRGAISGSLVSGSADGASIGFIVGSADERGHGNGYVIPASSRGTLVFDATHRAERSRDKKNASAGWKITITPGKQTSVFNVNNRDAEHPDAITDYHFATHNRVTLQQTRFPGTDLMLPAQVFVYVKTAAASEHPNALKLAPEYSTFEGPADATELSDFKVEEQAIIGQSPGFYRFKTLRPGDANDGSTCNAFDDFSVFVPAGIDASELRQINVLGHGERSRLRPQIPHSTVPAGMEISYFCQPGKVLAGPITDLGKKTPFVTVKIGDDGLCYVKRSPEAKNDETLNTYQALLQAPPGYLPNFNLSKITGGANSLTTFATSEAGDVQRIATLPSLVADHDSSDLLSIGGLSIKTRSIVVNPRRTPPSEEFCDVQRSIELAVMLNKNNKNNENAIIGVTVFACLMDEDSEASKAADTLEEEVSSDMALVEFASWEPETIDLPTHTKPSFAEHSVVRYLSYPIDSEGREMSHAAAAGLWSAPKPDDVHSETTVDLEWELVDADGRLLPATEENKAAVLKAQSDVQLD